MGDLELKQIQQALKCKGCFYCDEKARKRQEPCCTKPSAGRTCGMEVQDGVCLSRKSKGSK